MDDTQNNQSLSQNSIPFSENEASATSKTSGQSASQQDDATHGADPTAASQTQSTAQVQNAFITEAEYLQLKNELEQNQTKLKEMMVISQHALADLQNYKRRAEEDRLNFTQYATAQMILDFLPALNNVERALQHEPKDQEWIKGVEQTMKQFTQILEKQNVKVIETVGRKFDPKIHEALMTGPGEKDMILEEFEKGYMIGERTLKSARVKVGNGEVENQEQSSVQ